jgi:hypothetical protein
VPTNRRRRAHALAKDRLTPEVCEAWRAGDFHAVNQVLGVRPWQFSPFDVERTTAPAWLVDRRGSDSMVGVGDWQRAWELRQALIAAAGPPGRMDRHGRPLGPA